MRVISETGGRIGKSPLWFSPDGRHIVTGQKQRLLITNLESEYTTFLELPQNLKDKRVEITASLFHKDGIFIVALSDLTVSQIKIDIPPRSSSKISKDTFSIITFEDGKQWSLPLKKGRVTQLELLDDLRILAVVELSSHTGRKRSILKLPGTIDDQTRTVNTGVFILSKLDDLNEVTCAVQSTRQKYRSMAAICTSTAHLAIPAYLSEKESSVIKVYALPENNKASESNNDDQIGKVIWVSANLPKIVTNLVIHSRRLFWSDFGGRIFTQLFTTSSSETDQSMPSELIHWHTRTPIGFTVTSHGYILTGGEEGVLLAFDWRSGTKQMLPHLGSIILELTSSPLGDFYAARLSNNAILIVNAAALQVSQVIQRPLALSFGNPGINVDTDMFVNYQIDGKNYLALMNQIPGQIQPLNIVRDIISTDKSLNLAPQNMISRGSLKRNIPPSILRHVIFSPDECISASFDSIPSKQRRRAFDRLSFWNISTTHLKDKKSTHDTTIPTSVIESPHKRLVTALYCVPSSRKMDQVRFWTIAGKEVGVWAAAGKRVRAMRADGTNESEKVWVKINQLNLQETILASAISKDSSTVALACKDRIMLVATDSEDLSVIATIPVETKNHENNIRLVFSKLHETKLELLVIAVGGIISGIDLESKLPIWNVSLTSSCRILRCLSIESQILAVSGESKSLLSVIDVSTGTIVKAYCHRFRITDVSEINENTRDGIIFSDITGVLRVLSAEKSPIDTEPAEHSIPSATEHQETDISAYMARAVLESQPVVLSKEKHRKRNVLILPHVSPQDLYLSQVPSHLLPSMTAAFDHFITHLLPSNS